MSSIFTRKSVRKYKNRQVSDEIVTYLLKAAMQAPSAGNEQPWEFIVLRDKKTMKNLMDVHPYSGMLPSADVAIVVCGNRSREVFEGYWVQDCSAATENILLAAEEKEVGAVWLGVYPLEERIEGVKRLLGLPENVIPLSIVPVGYPDENRTAPDRFKKDRIHYETW